MEIAVRKGNSIGAHVERAIESSSELLNLREFVKSTGILDEIFMLDTFWYTMEEDTPIYVGVELIKWMGYDSKRECDRKMSFVKALPCAEDGITYYYQYSNEEYAAVLPDILRLIDRKKNTGDLHEIYPPAAIGKGSHKQALTIDPRLPA